jgi:hypothetical protein
VSLGAFLDTIQLVPPETLELPGPVMERSDRVGVGSIQHSPALAAHVNEADVS